MCSKAPLCSPIFLQLVLLFSAIASKQFRMNQHICVNNSTGSLRELPFERQNGKAFYPALTAQNRESSIPFSQTNWRMNPMQIVSRRQKRTTNSRKKRKKMSKKKKDDRKFQRNNKKAITDDVAEDEELVIEMVKIKKKKAENRIKKVKKKKKKIKKKSKKKKKNSQRSKKKKQKPKSKVKRNNAKHGWQSQGGGNVKRGRYDQRGGSVFGPLPAAEEEQENGNDGKGAVYQKQNDGDEDHSAADGGTKEDNANVANGAVSNTNNPLRKQQKHEEGQGRRQSNGITAKQVLNLMVKLAIKGVTDSECRWCAIQFLEKALLGPFAPLAVLISPKTIKRVRLAVNLGESLLAGNGAVVQGVKTAVNAISNAHIDQKATEAGKAVANVASQATHQVANKVHDTAKTVLKKFKFG